MEKKQRDWCMALQLGLLPWPWPAGVSCSTVLTVLMCPLETALARRQRPPQTQTMRS